MSNCLTNTVTFTAIHCSTMDSTHSILHRQLRGAALHGGAPRAFGIGHGDERGKVLVFGLMALLGVVGEEGVHELGNRLAGHGAASSSFSSVPSMAFMILRP